MRQALLLYLLMKITEMGECGYLSPISASVGFCEVGGKLENSSKALRAKM